MQIVEKVKSLLPSEVVSRIELEGSEIIVYTKDEQFFQTHESLIRSIVDQIKKRIEVRPEKNILLDQDFVKEKIKEIVPKEAGIKDIYFEPERSLVTIAAEKPGLVIGKSGETLRKIKAETFWVPRIERVPPIKSEIVEGIRKVIHVESKFRKEFLNKIGEKIFGERKTKRDWIRIIGLGGWREVGRSCILLETPKSKILIDCGVSAGATNANAFPIFYTKEFDPNEIDAIIISHSHLDHCGAVPYLYEFGYDGPLYCTTPTLDLFTLLTLDYIDVMQKSGINPLFTAKGVKEAVKHAITLEYNEVSDIAPDVRLTLANAGHILGCVTGDTLVMLSDGTISEINKLCNPHPQILKAEVLTDNLKLTSSDAIAFKKPYCGKMYKIETQVGEIIVTPEHPFFTFYDGTLKEVKAEELREGMFIAAPRKIHIEGKEQKLKDFPKSTAHNSIHISAPKKVTYELAQLVGYILGDGNKAWSGRKNKPKKSGILALHDENRRMLEFYRNLIKLVFKFSKKPKMKISRDKEKGKGLTLQIDCSELVKFFETNFPDILVNSTKRRIPKIIERCENKVVSGFLRGLFDAEGSVLIKNGNLELTMSSKNVVYETMLLLLRFGIISGIRQSKNYGWGKKSYRLTITDRDSIDLFHKLIGFDHPIKKIKIEKLVNKPRHPTRNSSSNTIPNLSRILRDTRKILKINRDDLPVSIKHFEKGHSISYKSLEKLLNSFNQKLESLNKFYSTKFNSWEELGKVARAIRITNVELGKLLGVSHSTIDNWMKNKNRSKYNELIQAENYIKQKLKEIISNEDLLKNLEILKNLLNEDIRWVKVKKIKLIKPKEREVYDLYVPKYHSFISNGLISHNSSLIHLHIGEGMHNILYAADQKFAKTNLLDPAQTNFQRVETLITESTYGGNDDIMPPLPEAEKQFMNIVNRTMERGGIALIPTFSVERGQEVMTILDNNNFQYPVFIDGMIWEANGIFTAYPEYMGKSMQKRIFSGDNPLTNPMFKRIASQQEREKAWEEKPCVILSTSGMLIGGPAIEHLKHLAEDEKNTLIFVGYQCEGTLGRRIQKGWTEIPFKTEEGKTITLNLKMEVQTVDGLSGHSDRNQLLGFINRLSVKPEKVVCVHGEPKKTLELAKAIHKIFRIETVAPRNLEAIRLK